MIILKTLGILFYEFFKIGLFAIGGGLATIPFLKNLAAIRPWFTSSMLSDMIAVSESTPGPVGVNMATYSGFMAGHQFGLFWGIVGAIVATFGLVTPSVIIIYFVSKAYRRFKENPLVNNAFYAVRPAVCGMIATVGMSIIASAVLKEGYTVREFYKYINLEPLILFVVLLLLMNVPKIKKLHPVVFIVLAGICGAVFSM